MIECGSKELGFQIRLERKSRRRWEVEIRFMK
jgi:hypothetical protein